MAGEGRFKRLFIDINLLIKQYKENIPLTKLAKNFKCSVPTIKRNLVELGIYKKQVGSGKIDAGKTYGFYTAIKYLGYRGRLSNPYWLCKCVCGKEVAVKSTHLRDGSAKSCGCQRPKGNNHVCFKGYGGIHRQLFNRWKQSAECRGIEFNITIKQAWNLFIKQKGKCAISGLEITLGKSYKEMSTASLDRINSTKGYTIDNIQWVHRYVNVMKNDFVQKDFIELCCVIAKYNGKL